MDRIKNITEVTRRLCGMIDPVGDASVDEIRLQNLQQTIDVVSNLLLDIEEVANCYSSGQHSIDTAKIKAKRFLNDVNERFRNMSPESIPKH